VLCVCIYIYVYSIAKLFSNSFYCLHLTLTFSKQKTVIYFFISGNSMLGMKFLVKASLLLTVSCISDVRFMNFVHQWYKLYHSQCPMTVGAAFDFEYAQIICIWSLIFLCRLLCFICEVWSMSQCVQVHKLRNYHGLDIRLSYNMTSKMLNIV
jgi:hypothetical protein